MLKFIDKFSPVYQKKKTKGDSTNRFPKHPLIDPYYAKTRTNIVHIKGKVKKKMSDVDNYLRGVRCIEYNFNKTIG